MMPLLTCWNVKSKAINRNNQINDIGNWSSNFDWFLLATAAQHFYLLGISDHRQDIFDKINSNKHTS